MWTSASAAGSLSLTSACFDSSVNHVPYRMGMIRSRVRVGMRVRVDVTKPLLGPGSRLGRLDLPIAWWHLGDD